MESQKAHLIYGLSGLFTSHLILAEDEKAAKELYEDYAFMIRVYITIRRKICSFFRQIFMETF